MSTEEQRLAELAADDVREAIQNLAHDRLGHSERLADEDVANNLDEAGFETLCGRYEAQIRRYLGEGEPLVAEETIRAALLNFSWWNYGLDEVSETESKDWAAALAKDIAQAVAMAERAQQL